MVVEGLTEILAEMPDLVAEVMASLGVPAVLRLADVESNTDYDNVQGQRDVTDDEVIGITATKPYDIASSYRQTDGWIRQATGTVVVQARSDGKNPVPGARITYADGQVWTVLSVRIVGFGDTNLAFTCQVERGPEP